MKEINLHIKIGFAQMDELQTDDRELVEKPSLPPTTHMLRIANSM